MSTRRVSTPIIGLAPLVSLLSVFLIVPTVVVFVRALRTSTANRLSDEGHWSFSALRTAFTGQNRDAFVFSIRLSLQAAIIGVVIGTLIAYTVTTLRRPRWLRAVVTSFSGVAANLGGIPLAFAFIALLGRQGLLTKVVFAVTGWKLYDSGFKLDSPWGLTLVYSYFNIPLMVLVILPAIEGLKPAWREACANLGGTSTTFWLRVGGPVLGPSVLGGLLLLFANSFSAYATAEAIGQSSLLVPLRIGFYLNGDISANEDQVGFSLAAWMILVMTITMSAYWLLRRRVERWQR
jgi:putative spermidine/putrescine transport system permease protein